ncbi:GtrA family protein [Halococcus dombrowskii]|uniref:GtrA family protein n=1 Tax=Halococcus dombrowskii TaxID=179637 RepID=A0AAV3SGI0_HALDO|nr:GtrA family protein [Halococcus dombrowskii]UOO93927.1 GtrA family protein [Halococcus dombrowskii]
MTDDRTGDSLASAGNRSSRSDIGQRLSALASGSRFGRFVSVGVVGALFDVTTATALRELGVFPELAVFVGIEVSILVMFVLNDTWTFSGEGAAGRFPMVRRLVRSNVVRIGGILVQLAAFRVLYRMIAVDLTLLGIDGWFVVAKVAGIAAGMIVNYIAESLFTWRVHTTTGND